MAKENTVATLDGLFKEVYGEGPVNLVPEVAYLQKRVQFKQAQRIGKSYNFPVVLSQEHGVTYLAAGSGVSTLEDSVAATLKDAEVDAHQIILRGQMDYEAAAKSQGGDRVAFKNSTQLLVENLMDSAGKRLEIAMLYGRSPTGIGVADSSANVDTTNTDVTMLAAGWAPGIWSGLEGCQVNFYAVSNNALVSSAANAIFTVVSVNYSTRVIRFSGTTTGISALDSALSSGDQYVHFKNARLAEPIGLDAITLNTGSLFGINASSFGLWAGSTYNASGALTAAKILSAVSLAVGKGGLMEEADVLVSPKTFTNLSSSLTDLRRDSADSKEGIAGFEAIKIYGPNGKLNIVSHPMVKEGEAFIAPMKRVKRIGSSEASFKTPGRQDEIFLHIPDKNAYELRLYMAQAIIAEKPAQLVKITGITNS